MLTRILIPAILILASCGPSAPRPAKLPVAEASFTGDAACASCHEDEYASFQTHGMANSFYPMTPDRVIEDFDADPVYHDATDFWYRAFRDGERFFQEEYRMVDGQKTHSLIRRMTHVVGSAQAARTYVSEANGRYYELPLTWYAQRGIWDFSPGYRESNQRFDRKLTARCMSCHTDAPPRLEGLPDVFERAPRAVSCERCHGPASDHVAARLAVPEPEGEIDPTIVNPAHLDLDARLDVCQQCHLNGTVVMYPDGNDPYDFRPGQRLADHQIMYASAHEDGLDVISHADRMKQSACFIQTQSLPRPMDCTTCHNPHKGFRELGPDYFNATCQSCHATVATQVPDEVKPSHTATANCISCHMVKREAEDAPHSSFTDHFIRASVTDQRPASADEPLILEPLYGDGNDADLARAYLTYGWSRDDQDATARGLTLATAREQKVLQSGNAALLLGNSLLSAGRVDEAVEALRTAVRADTTEAERMQSIARALEASGDMEEAELFFRRARQLAPRSVAIMVDFGRFLQNTRKFEEAERLYSEAVSEEPWNVEAQSGLAATLLSQGRLEEAIGAAEAAIKLNPDHVDALTNLGVALGRLGELERAKEVLTRAATLGWEKGNLLPHFNLGLVALEMGEWDTAINGISYAVRMNPEDPGLRVLLARAFLGKGQLPAALAQVNAALNSVPGHEGATQLKAEIEQRQRENDNP